MNSLPKELQDLVNLLTRLPSLGAKSAERIALYVLKANLEYVEGLSAGILKAKTDVGLCERCQSFSSGQLCLICEDLGRDNSKVCVVEDPMDVYAIERGGFFNGVYHVLHGVVDPLNHVELDELKVVSLQKRVRSGVVEELILATNPDAKGETTALHLEKLFENTPNLKITRIAYGLPRGADIEYADEVTLKASIEYRREV